jgi:ParB family transcriptional regulator, chromosome partitioning protein
VAEKKGGLGRGIGSLIPTSEKNSERPVDVFFPAGGTKGPALATVPGARFGHLDVNAIAPNAKQPRSVLNQKHLKNLFTRFVSLEFCNRLLFAKNLKASMN